VELESDRHRHALDPVAREQGGGHVHPARKGTTSTLGTIRCWFNADSVFDEYWLNVHPARKRTTSKSGKLGVGSLLTHCALNVH
jgi:hypothetical protein